MILVYRIKLGVQQGQIELNLVNKLYQINIFIIALLTLKLCIHWVIEKKVSNDSIFTMQIDKLVKTVDSICVLPVA